MSDTGGTNSMRNPPSPPRECRSAAGYEICFYPGFVRRLAVVEGDAETVVYEQQGVFYLPAGQDRPWPSHSLEVRGNGRDLMMHLHDPRQEVDSVEIVLKPGTEGKPPVRLIVQDGPVLCPPFCPE